MMTIDDATISDEHNDDSAADACNKATIFRLLEPET